MRRLLSCVPAGLSGPGSPAAFPLALSTGIGGSAGLSAPPVRHGVGRAQAHRPGRRQRGRHALRPTRRLLPAVSAPKFHPDLFSPRSVRGPQ